MEKILKFLVVTIMLVAPVVCALSLLMSFPLIGMLFIVPAVFNLYYALGMVDYNECIYRDIA